jgi:hypothetical protein
MELGEGTLQRGNWLRFGGFSDATRRALRPLDFVLRQALFLQAWQAGFSPVVEEEKAVREMEGPRKLLHDGGDSSQVSELLRNNYSTWHRTRWVLSPNERRFDQQVK